MRACVIPECVGVVSDDAPLPLCDQHMVVAAEWSTRFTGVTDVLPSPCPACGSRLGVRWPTGWLCAVCEWRLGEHPDDELAPPRVDIVYYLGYADRVKIGTTANPRQRFAAIRHDALLAIERGDRVIEARRHAQFADARYPRTEWFQRTSALERHIGALAAGTPDPWTLHARWLSEAYARRG